jgi:hypothetical protein
MSTDNDQTDSYTPDNSAEGIAARIDRMVQGAESRHSIGQPMQTTVAAPRTNLRYQSATDSFQDLDSGETFSAADVEAEAAAAGDTGRIADDGRDLSFSLKQMADELTRLQSKLQAGSFDPKTGRKVLELEGQSRDAHQRMYDQLITSFKSQAHTNARIERQRDADRAAAEQAQRDEVEAESAIEREVQARVLAIEVEERAKAIIAARKRNTGGY